MSPSLLLVEDDPLEARRLAGALSHLGYHCTLAHDGDDALARLAERRFDAVLLDLVLPGLDGMGVLSALAARGDATPMVVQVTPAGLDAAAGAIRAGALDFVVKPAGALRLEVALANAVALGRARSRATPAAPEPARAEPCNMEPCNVIALPLGGGAGDDAEGSGTAFVRLEASGHARRLDQIEAEAIRFACRLYGGRMAEVARRLGIGRSTLYRKIAGLDGDAVETNLPAEPSAPRFVAAE